MTTEVGFYHLTRGRIEQVLPRLMVKVLEAGHRAVVRGRDPQLLRLIDDKLWTEIPESFLPHALYPCENAEVQPILLTEGQEVPNGAKVAVLLDPELPEDASQFSRLLLMFDGEDSAALAQAREVWKKIKQVEGLTASYWTQGEKGGWQKSA